VSASAIAAVEPLLFALDRPSAIAALRRSPALLAASVRRPVTRAVRLTFFDTPAGDLAQRTVALGLYESGRRRLRIVRRLDGPASAAMPVPDRPMADGAIVPDLAGLDLAPAVADPIAAALRPFAEARLRRTVWTLAHQAARLLLALDDGDLGIRDRREPVRDVTLLHQDGPAEALADFAQTLAASVPLVLRTSRMEQRACQPV
jgi:inorganic triphosphatase YgiF